MKVYHLHQKQFLPLSLEDAWSFFTSPTNLVKITPGEMNFKILHISGNQLEIYPGQIITYTLRIFPLINSKWTTEITHVQKLKYFVDEQRIGPYRLWHHEHIFHEVTGGVEMVDEIAYAIPYGIIGRMVHFLFVKKQLKKIFAYRYQVLTAMFANAQALKKNYA